MVYSAYEVEEHKRKKKTLAAGVIFFGILLSATVVFLSRNLGSNGLMSYVPRANERKPTSQLKDKGYILVDKVPPTVSFISPDNGSHYATRVTVKTEANAADNETVYKVEFYLDDAIRCRVKTAPYICSFVMGDKPNTKYVLTVKAFDLYENTAVDTRELFTD